MSTLRIFVAGDPPIKGQMRLKRTRRGRILLFLPDESRAFETRVRDQAVLAMRLADIEPLRGCVTLAVSALWSRRAHAEAGGCPECHCSYRPEQGAVLSAVTRALSGVAYEHAGQIVRTNVESFVARSGQDAAVAILVSDLHEEGP